MVNIVKPKIYTGASQMEEFAEDFRKETLAMLKKVAFENNCSVEELKFTIDNCGIVNIRRMTADEMIKMNARRLIDKSIRAIRGMKGLD